MKQITEDKFEKLITEKNDFKVLITLPTCERCHDYINSHQSSQDFYFEVEESDSAICDNNIVSNFLIEAKVEYVPIFVKRTNSVVKLEEPEME